MIIRRALLYIPPFISCFITFYCLDLFKSTIFVNILVQYMYPVYESDVTVIIQVQGRTEDKCDSNDIVGVDGIYHSARILK